MLVAPFAETLRIGLNGVICSDAETCVQGRGLGHAVTHISMAGSWTVGQSPALFQPLLTF